MNDPFLPEEIRVFVACELPMEWQEALGDLGHTLARSLAKAVPGPSPVRWVRPEGIHLTLKFLGDVGRHLLPDLQQALEVSAAGRHPFELRLDGLGSFGGRGRVRVVWAGLTGDIEALTDLQRRLDTQLSTLGFARELRPFSPHLTLGRVPDNVPAEAGARIVAALRQTAPPAVPAYRVRDLSLIRSQLSPKGATYTRLVSVPLSAQEPNA